MRENKIKHLTISQAQEVKEKELYGLEAEKNELLNSGSDPLLVSETDKKITETQNQLDIIKDLSRVSNDSKSDSFSENLDIYRWQKEEQLSELQEIQEELPEENKELVYKIGDTIKTLDDVDELEEDLISKEEREENDALLAVEEFMLSERQTNPQPEAEPLSKSEGKKRKIEVEDYDNLSEDEHKNSFTSIETKSESKKRRVDDENVKQPTDNIDDNEVKDNTVDDLEMPSFLDDID